MVSLTLHSFNSRGRGNHNSVITLSSFSLLFISLKSTYCIYKVVNNFIIFLTQSVLFNYCCYCCMYACIPASIFNCFDISLSCMYIFLSLLSFFWRWLKRNKTTRLHQTSATILITLFSRFCAVVKRNPIGQF